MIGRFFGDWDYALIYDFAGSSDGFAGTASANGTSVGFLPGGELSGIQNAYLSYRGIKPFGGQLAIEGGYITAPYTLDEATSSNDILFMERASSQVIAANIAAGDPRSAFGARWYNDRFWAGAYATGPSPGAIHSASSTNPNGSTEQLGAVARVAGQPISGNGYSLHLGADAEFLIKPPHNLVDNSFTLTLSDRPELRIDPTVIITTGAMSGVSEAQVYSAEAAATYGPLFFQGEYFWYNVARNNVVPSLPSLQFQGGYAEASLVLTGETHPYIPATGAYGGIIPADPFSLWGGGWGAWELAGRVSTMNLNNQLGTTNGVAGGQQTIYAAGLNWYVNGNVRFMFDYTCTATSPSRSARPTTEMPVPGSTQSRCARRSPSEQLVSELRRQALTAASADRPRSSWSQAGTSVLHAVLANTPTLEGWQLVQMTTVAIAYAIRVHASLFTRLSGCQGSRGEIGIAGIEYSDTHGQRHC